MASESNRRAAANRPPGLGRVRGAARGRLAHWHGLRHRHLSLLSNAWRRGAPHHHARGTGDRRHRCARDGHGHCDRPGASRGRTAGAAVSTLKQANEGESLDVQRRQIEGYAHMHEAERDRIRERIGQAKADQKSRGRFLGGDVPFGFEVGADGALVPIGAQQEAIREMAALRAQGRSLRAIRDEMRAKGFQISHEGVARILKGRWCAWHQRRAI
jgi:hypothetical protein